MRRRAARGRPLAPVLWALVAWTALAGCHAGLTRMAARGQHEAVVAAAGRARILPRGKAARAWASSLVALGRTEEARSVLLRDFRKHAEVPSLVALADLEAAEGREGLAAAHYARASSLEVDVLTGRRDVCELFRRRASRFFAEGEAIAADLDLRRVLMICPKRQGPQEEAQHQRDRALHADVVAAAERQARAQRTLAGCAEGACRTPSPDALAAALERELTQARAAGPGALRAAAGRSAAQLAAGDVAVLLAAELRGDLGLDLVTIDELRGWIGEASPGDAVKAADSLVAPIERDYVRLRLSQLGPGYELPGDDAARSTASAVIRLLETFDADPGAAAMSWRVFVLLGDLPSAELSLSTSLRGAAGRTRGAAVAEELARELGAGPGVSRGTGPGGGREAGAPAAGKAAVGDSGDMAESSGPGGQVAGADRSRGRVQVPRPSLWSARAEIDGASLPKLLLLSRLRGLAGQREQALSIAAWALAEAQARGLPAIGELAAGEVRHELAAGRPWAALTLASVVTGAPAEAALQAVGAALVLERASCGERCGEADDRSAARQLFGEPWLIAQETRAAELAFARPAPGRRDAACPLLAEQLAPDAAGGLATTLRTARREGLRARGVPDGLTRAIEADLTLQCAGRLAVPLLYAADARVATEQLADMLSHAPQEVGSGQLAVQSELALVLGRRDAADQLAIAAAAASAEPRRVWRRAAAMAALVDARHHELLALRQLLMHGPDARTWADARLRLVVRAIRDANDAWAPRNAEAGREAFLRGAAGYIEDVAPARRWHAREELAFALAEYEWADAEAAELVRAALWPDPATALAHPAGVLRLERALGGVGDAPSPSPLAPRELAAWMSLGAGSKAQVGTSVPALSEALLPVDAVEAARMAALRRAAEGDARRRAAIAVAVTGGAAGRREALARLLGELPPERRAAVLDTVLAGLGALAAEGVVPMVEGDDELLALVFGVARDPARRRPEIKGQ